MQQVLLGIDVGTASSKGVLATADGRVLRTAARPHELLLPRPGWAEADAESTWWGDIVALCRELLGSLDPAQVAGVCVSGLGPCLLACDQNLRPLRPAILYGIDTRASAEIVELTEKYGAEALFKHCGKSLSSQAVGPKMLWLRRNEPEVWARTAAWFSSHSYAVGKLTGEYVLDHHTASQCDPLYDITENTWIPNGRRSFRPAYHCLGWCGRRSRRRGVTRRRLPRPGCRPARPSSPAQSTRGRRLSARA